MQALFEGAVGSYYNPNELRASSSAFMWGRLVFTTYKTGCLRKILVQSCAASSSIDPKYMRVGNQNEERHEARVIKERRRYQREYGFKAPIGETGITLSGHIDFVYFDEEGIPCSLDELKSITSTTTYRNIIKKGEYLIENLAQTVNYMVAARVRDARLIYTFYAPIAKGAEEHEAKDERVFTVHIDDFGRVIVDGEPTRWTVQDQLAHQVHAARAIAAGAVGPRPHLWDAPFASPCGYCPYAAVCNDWDKGLIESDEAFVNICKSLVSKE